MASETFYEDMSEDDDAALYAGDDPELEREIAEIEAQVDAAVDALADETGASVSRDDVLKAAFLSLGFSEREAFDAMDDEFAPAEGHLLDAARGRAKALRAIDEATVEIQAELDVVYMRR